MELLVQHREIHAHLQFSFVPKLIFQAPGNEASLMGNLAGH